MASRREFLGLGFASVVSLHALTRRAFAADPPAPRGPRYFASIFLSGGIDAIYTTDPKTRAEVEGFVDVPYARDSIVEAGNVRLGPHFAPLSPHASRLAIVNGVAVHTANHNTGTEQFVRMRTRTHPQMPTILSVIGAHRDTQAIGTLGWSFGAPAFQKIFDEPADDLRRMSELLRQQETAIRARHPEPRSAQTAENLRDASALLARAAKAKPLAYETWSEDDGAQAVARSLQRVLWAFENDLTRGYELNVGSTDQPWDTHTFNAERQTSESRKIPVVARFIAELMTRKTARGPLADETLVMIGSEIGRFPALNTQAGKDHFPEIPLVFFGAGIQRGVFGRTGKSMQALPVSLHTGRDTPERGHTLRLDDIGATLLHIAGIPDPNVYGYDGTILPFLAAT